MKKTLLTTVLMYGMVGSAHAGTSVTLYGIIDTGLGYTQFKNQSTDIKATRTGFYDSVQSGNRWGLRGSEDLGDGLRTVFALESGFTLQNGKAAQGDRLFGREATLGLAHDNWGSMVFGRQLNVASHFIGPIGSPFGDTMQLAAIGKTFSSTATVRADNTIVYATPNMNGLDFAIGYSFNVNGSQAWRITNTKNTNPSDSNGKLLTTGLRYANGPVAVAVSYDNLTASAWGKAAQAWSLAGSYDFTVIKLHAAWGQERNGNLVARGYDSAVNAAMGFAVIDSSSATHALGGGGDHMDGYKTNNVVIGLSVPAGVAGKLMAAWGMTRVSDNAWFEAHGDKKSQNLFSVGYTYDLSKRTNLYSVASYGRGYAFQDVRATQAILGLRHRF